MMLANLSPFFVATQLAKTSGVEKIYVAKNVCVCSFKSSILTMKICLFRKGPPFKKRGKVQIFEAPSGCGSESRIAT